MAPHPPDEYWFEQIMLLKQRVSELEAATQATFRQRLRRLLRRVNV